MAKKYFDLETDLHTSPKITAQIENVAFAQLLYAALCNNQFRHTAMTIDDAPWSCSWRVSGDIVARLRNAYLPDANEQYIDYYCSGAEGHISYEIEQLFGSLGWYALGWPEEAFI